MSFEEGSSLPDLAVYEFDVQDGPTERRLPDLAYKKKVVAIGVPGAFTPVCSESHLPGYLNHYQDFKDAGIDELWCIAVNDAFVLKAWADALKIDDKVRMLSDGSAELVRAMEVTLDLTAKGMGVRSDRFAMVIDNGQVTHFFREKPGHLHHSDAATVLQVLQDEMEIG